MDPNIDTGDRARKNILNDQMKHSKGFDSEVKHYLRTPADRTYRFLIGAIDRYLEIDRMERSRKAQMQGREREKDNKQALGAVAPAGDSRNSGGYPAGTASTLASRSPPPCIAFQTGERQKGKGQTVRSHQSLGFRASGSQGTPERVLPVIWRQRKGTRQSHRKRKEGETFATFFSQSPAVECSWRLPGLVQYGQM